jgi:hypothetical protein
MTFSNIKSQLQERFNSIVANQQHLFTVAVEKYMLWNTYLQGFSENTRQEHNCNSCRQFVKSVGNVVAIDSNGVHSFWDFECGDPEWQLVLNAMRDLVLNAPIDNVFVTPTRKLGTDFNLCLSSDKTSVRWEHFFVHLPVSLVYQGSASEDAQKGMYRDSKNVLKRSLEELSIESVEIVLALISQKSLYRGQEFEGLLKSFKLIQHEYHQLDDSFKDIFCWRTSLSASGSITRIRNSAIGTLLIDISSGMELNEADRRWNNVMAPTNYKRPTPIISTKMIEQAEKTIEELGLLESLGRRFATSEDVRVSDVLFVDRSKKATGIFNELKDSVPVKTLSRIEEIRLNEFIDRVMPTATSIDLLLENKHEPNLVSLIAPTNPSSMPLFKWNNGFSWCYNNNLADSMKERVKSFGGKVDGVLRFSIQWNDDGKNNIDFDAHCIEPNGNEIYYSNKHNLLSSGDLDVDIVCPREKVAVENITWSNINKMQLGVYHFFVHNYSSATSNAGFSAEIEYNGQIHTFVYPQPLHGKQRVIVAKINFNKGNELIFNESLKSTIASKEMWGLSTNKFHRVLNIMNSPNHWDDSAKNGNRHTFFFLEQCVNDDARGFFNEFLREDLNTHRKVFEALGGRMKVSPSNNQLSGVGFSETIKNDFTVKVHGSFERTLKVITG